MLVIFCGFTCKSSFISLKRKNTLRQENFSKEKFLSVCDGIPTGIPSIFGKAKGFSEKWKVILFIQWKNEDLQGLFKMFINPHVVSNM